MVLLRVIHKPPLGTGVAVDSRMGSTTAGYWMCTDCWMNNNETEAFCYGCGAGPPEDDE